MKLGNLQKLLLQVPNLLQNRRKTVIDGVPPPRM